MQPTYFKKRGFALTRRFRAPVAAVWSAWTEPEQLGWFFNPDNATTVPTTVPTASRATAFSTSPTSATASACSS